MLLRLILQQLIRQTAEQTLRDAMTREAGRSGSDDPSTGQGGQAAAGEGEESSSYADAKALPPCQIAILFASAVEAGGTLDLLKEPVETRCVGLVEYQGWLGNHRVAVGVPRSPTESIIQAAKDLISFHKPRWFVTAGFAASLQPDVKRNHLLIATEIMDTSGKRLKTGLQIDRDSLAQWPSIKVGRLLTSTSILRIPKEREALGSEHQALAADLESMSIAEVCQISKTPCLSIRIITEALDDRLSDELEHLQRQESWAGKLGATAGALMRRPETLKDWWSVKQRGLEAADRLGKLIAGMIAQLP